VNLRLDFFTFLILEVKIKWTDRIMNDDVFQRAKEERLPLKTLKNRHHSWIGHIIRHNDNFHSCAVRLDTIMVFYFHQGMQYIYLLRSTLIFTLKFTLKLLLHVSV